MTRATRGTVAEQPYDPEELARAHTDAALSRALHLQADPYPAEHERGPVIDPLAAEDEDFRDYYRMIELEGAT